MLLAMRPLPLVSLASGKQVGAIAMGHIRVALPQVPVTIGEDVGSEPMPETPAILTSIVAVVCALLHAQAVARPLLPLPLVVVAIVVLTHAEAVSAALLKVAAESGALGKSLTAEAVVPAAHPLQQPREKFHTGLRPETFISVCKSGSAINEAKFCTPPPPRARHHLTYPASERLQLPALVMASLLWQCRTTVHVDMMFNEFVVNISHVRHMAMRSLETTLIHAFCWPAW